MIVIDLPAPHIEGVQIRVDQHGRFCLNDLHRASGGERRHGPSLWLGNDSTRELVAQLAREAGDTGNPVSVARGGPRQGTYVSKELVYAYAMWVSARFHLTVIRAYDRLQRGARSPAIPGTFAEALRLAALQQEELDRQASQIASMVPQVQALHRLASEGDKSLCLQDAAKHLQLSPRTQFIPWLLSAGWLYRRTDNSKLVAFQERLDSQHLKHVMRELERTDGSTIQELQVRVTQKGMARLAWLIGKGKGPASATA